MGVHFELLGANENNQTSLKIFTGLWQAIFMEQVDNAKFMLQNTKH